MTGISACSADRYNSSPLWGKRNGDATSGWGKVMHAEFDLGSTQMDASDPPFRVINDGAVRLMIRLDSKEEVLKAVEMDSYCHRTRYWMDHDELSAYTRVTINRQNYLIFVQKMLAIY